MCWVFFCKNGVYFPFLNIFLSTSEGEAFAPTGCCQLQTTVPTGNPAA